MSGAGRPPFCFRRSRILPRRLEDSPPGLDSSIPAEAFECHLRLPGRQCPRRALGQRLQKLRAIQQYQYVMHVLDRKLSYEEVAEIFVRVNSLGVKLRSSDLAMSCRRIAA